MKKIKKFDQFVLEDFADDYPKNKWEDITDTRDKYDELVGLIQNAYKNVPGGNLENPEDIKRDKRVNYWTAIDVDGDPECDAVIFGKKPITVLNLMEWVKTVLKRQRLV